MGSFRDEIRGVPFLKITIPFVVGIVISQEFRLLWSVLFLSVVALLCLIFLFKREFIKNCTTFLLLVALGFCAAQAAAPTRQLPRGEKIEALIEVADGLKYTSKRTRQTTSAYVRAYRTAGDSSWHKSNERVVIYVDTTTQLSVGQLFAAEVYANDVVRDGETSYSRLMRARGVTSALFVRSQNVRDWNVGYVNSLEYGARIFRNRVSEQLCARLKDRDDGAVLAALLTGDRSHLTPQLKRRYQLAGASHILALSGMHLSMIFIVFNLLLKPLVLLGRRMNLAKSLVILLII